LDHLAIDHAKARVFAPILLSEVAFVTEPGKPIISFLTINLLDKGIDYTVQIVTKIY